MKDIKTAVSILPAVDPEKLRKFEEISKDAKEEKKPSIFKNLFKTTDTVKIRREPTTRESLNTVLKNFDAQENPNFKLNLSRQILKQKNLQNLSQTLTANPSIRELVLSETGIDDKSKLDWFDRFDTVSDSFTNDFGCVERLWLSDNFYFGWQQYWTSRRSTFM
jgi:hypothetical protein